MVTESISIEPLPSFEGWTCPLPLRDSPNVVMGHGGGGAMSAELVEHVFLPAFDNGTLGVLGDSAVLDVAGSRLAFSTDSFVVRPLFFPGGSIGDLAVNGTVNDLAMSGATPLYLSAGFILEEGVEIAHVGAVAQRLGKAAQRAGVRVVTGDTKVVESGHGDGIYVNTAGIGVIPDGVDIRPDRARPGDRVIVSGDLGVHGVAIMSVREGLEFGTEIRSDCHPCTGSWRRCWTSRTTSMCCATRPAVAWRPRLNEIASSSGVGIALDERALPIPEIVADACSLLGLDPLQVANEGKLVAFVAPEEADEVLAAMRAHPAGAGAVVVGECVADHPGMVSARTGFGAERSRRPSHR